MSIEQLIVVGVDGSEGGRRALAWAARHAATSGATIQVVTAYDGGGQKEADNRRDAEGMQRWEIDNCSEVGLGRAVVAREVVVGDAVGVLADAARKADLLVLGTHGKSHLRTALLGSVSDGCIRRAVCPVVVVPVPKPEPRSAEIVQQREGAEAAHPA
jgi:nucleotide-binding universal stress UspA family protein